MFKDVKAIIHHILIFILSSAIALSLPYTGKLIADNYLTYWSLIESDPVLLNSLKIAVAVLLIIFFKETLQNHPSGMADVSPARHTPAP